MGESGNKGGIIEKGQAIEVNEDNNPYCNKTK